MNVLLCFTWKTNINGPDDEVNNVQNVNKNKNFFTDFY